jgi:hypothetical protein
MSLMVADFDHVRSGNLKRDWAVLADKRPSDDARLSLEAAKAGGNEPANQVLRLAYRMPTGGEGEHGVEAVLHLPELDASSYDHLTFLVRGDAKRGYNHQFEVGFRKRHPGVVGLEDMARVRVSGIGPDWRRVTIPLNQMMGIRDWRGLTGFHIALAGRDTRVARGAYLFDEFALIKTGDPGPSADDQVVAPRKDAWDREHGGQAAGRVALKQRLNGWPAQVRADANSLPKDDREWLLRLAADTWRGLDALSDREHGLPLDRVQFKADSVQVEQAFIGDYTSTTNIGFRFLSVIAAHELRFIGREQALAKLKTVLDALERMETYRGFFYNYYNTTTLERTSNFVSFVDSTWLTAGLMTARQAFPELAARCDRLIAQGDYRFFYDEHWNLMSHGYYVNLGQRATYHYGALYSEARLGSLIAIGKGEAPPSHWFAMARTYPNEFTWQSRHPLQRREKEARGFRWVGGYYDWREYRYVPSWGGSMFEALMPVLLLDEARYAPDSLGRNDRIHTAIQRHYALDELEYLVWGMSPSSTPGSEHYGEYGVRLLGSLGYGDGVVTPHAAALALLTEPEAAVANLRTLLELYPIYGEFGFYDAVNPQTGEVAYHYLCLNQAMILVALANHLADHAVQKHFAAHPFIQRVLPLIGFENFLD